MNKFNTARRKLPMMSVVLVMRMVLVPSSRMSLATSRQLPAQKPGRSRVVWIGRPAGEVMARISGTCPLATEGWTARPNSAWARTSTVGPAGAE